MAACVAIVILQRINGKFMYKLFHFLLFLLLSSSILNGCAPLNTPPTQTRIDLSNAGFLTVYLNHSATENQLQIGIDKVEIYIEEEWLPLTKVPDTQIDTQLEQQLIAASSLPSGFYSQMRFQITVLDMTGTVLRQEQAELPLSHPVEIKAGSSSCLFVNSQLALRNLNQPLRQQLQAWSQQRSLADELLYILCPEIQTLYLARVDPYRIVAAHGVGDGIVDMVLDNDRKLLYLLDQRQRLIQRFDTINQTLTDRIPLPLTDQPGHLGISANGKTLYVSDSGNRQLLQIDARNGLLRQQLTTSYQPDKLYPFNYLQQEYLAVLYSGDQQLQVMPAKTLVPLYSISTGLQPSDLIFTDQSLFINDLFLRQVTALEPLTGQVQIRTATAFAPQTLAADPANRNLLIGMCQQSALAFLPFGQQLISRYTSIAGCPTDLTLAQQRRILFIAMRDKQQIGSIDLLSEQPLGIINIASKPSILAFQEP